ncbi:type III-B CRISPR module RAMP protein Cmr6 [Ahniella affigens]|uniref:Type III-B CRISPR module RAMP protein Cmr6 n=1 Tax=Ahniella affigens TaxID=2021234 RepID=A0A2P1PTS2_9GAMM|nr:type III-B CRISPR module RAMP protein Cmr6 [Ahniella affigens]AVP98231.1 type III-B CRISPR module RAMP protein Cmr6 [Ahniella affigens]
MADPRSSKSGNADTGPSFALWRDADVPLRRNTRTANAGLLIRRGMQQVQSESGPDKDALLARITGITACKGYEAAFERWKSALLAIPNTLCFVGTVTTRLYIGAIHDTALESGCTTHHSYGMPMIPGSSVKGVCRHAAKAWGLDEPDHGDPKLRSLLAEVFGDHLDNDEATTIQEPFAGTAIFHDAWWDPTPRSKPFVREIVTPHHQGYYDLGREDATDFDSPIPAPQLAAQGQFLFAVTGLDEELAAFAARLLKTTLHERGIGSKTTSGYGYFNRPDSFDDLSSRAPA